MSPSVEQFRALARSSPWRWQTLRYTVAWQSVGGPPVRAWVRRPGRLRVEDATGRVLGVARDPRRVVGVATAEPAPSGADTSGAALSGADDTGAMALAWPHEVEPETDADGLVRRRPFLAAYDDPVYRDYRWVAMLDPAELADPEPGVGPDVQPIVVEELHATRQHGRPVWQARVRPTAGYAPRCACCALLFCAHSHALAGLAGPAAPPLAFPEAHRVRLDVATGVCVFTEELGGARPGSGHDLAIEAVDEDMPEELFDAAPPRR